MGRRGWFRALALLASVAAPGDGELVVRLVTDEPFDASHLWLRGEGAAQIPLVRFPPEGELRFEGVPAGRVTLSCVWPSGDAWWRDVHLVAGEPWVVEIELAPEVERVVELGASDGRELGAGVLVELSGIDGRGETCRRRAALGADQRARFYECALRDGWVEAWDGGVLLGAARVRFERSTARVELVDRSLVVQLVDGCGAALRGGEVEVATCEPGAPWSLRSAADARGRAELRGLGFDELVVAVRHPSAGTRTNLVVPLERHGPTELEIVMGAGQELVLRLVDDGLPLPGVAVALHGSVRPLFLSARHTDAAGVARWGRLEPGAYEVHVEQRGRWPTWEAFELTGAPVEIEVPSRGDLTLRAIDRERQPIAGARVELRWLGQDQPVADWVAERRVTARPGDLRTDARGELELLGLPRGRYELLITTLAGARRRERIEVPGGARRTRTLTVR